ncbi:hypothetical protein G3A_05165 [Bacillus sp. 17376]|uniref:Spore coat protein Z n=1 Tax=Mesobacillus boroniphilus JCM 21738 TaxID=1294265 RepID=W4RTR6_9BACI|nr:CotY/CotZ family spore coat protein [Mesobacillus boroniphilus]ESU33593.1 hypothetical protein G3A_05165 [Bacillus sp. 17376]GAE47815.1 hypothetical protein JCM21738_4835 [Mesobacillus boroniphilus JCM 21738]
MFTDHEHYEHNCKCSKCKRKKERKYFKHMESSDCFQKESSDWKHEKHKGDKRHDHHESSDWKHKKHKDHEWHDHHESDDWKYQKHKDHNWHEYDESGNLDYYKKADNGCVCDKVKEINLAQKKVAGKKQDCEISCERSIKELLGNCKHSKFDTIPFKLLCGCIGECETFVGTGVVNIDGCFFDIRSSFFRVVDFVKGSDCCVILELLCPERCEGNHGISGFVRTGACFEVDLNDFTGITCFPPVTAKKMDPKRLLNGGNKKKSRY